MFYHLSPTENKQSILKNGLEARCMPNVYLADCVIDTFLMAPPSFEYVYIYKYFMNLYYGKSFYWYTWEERSFEFSVFSIDLDLNLPPCFTHPSKHKMEKKLFGEIEGSDRCAFEYITDHIPKTAIVDVVDYKLPFLCVRGPNHDDLIMKYLDVISKMTNEGHTRTEANQYIRDNYFQDFPPFFIPWNNINQSI